MNIDDLRTIKEIMQEFCNKNAIRTGTVTVEIHNGTVSTNFKEENQKSSQETGVEQMCLNL